MARKSRPGLRKRGEYWHIEKVIKGHRIYESTGEKDYRRAEAYYDSRINDIRKELMGALPCGRDQANSLLRLSMEVIHLHSYGDYRRGTLDLARLIAEAGGLLRDPSLN